MKKRELQWKGLYVQWFVCLKVYPVGYLLFHIVNGCRGIILKELLRLFKSVLWEDVVKKRCQPKC